MKVICIVCKKEFLSHREKSRKQDKCCSIECRIKSKDKIINCLECGKTFRVSQSKNRKFCSSACANKYNKKPDLSKKSIFTCGWCGKEFEEWTYRNPKMCSRQCNSEYGASIRAKQLYKGGSSSRGAEWRRIAKSIRERDGYKCAVCGIISESIHVHHIKPVREFNGIFTDANHPQNLICLCVKCHPKVESGKIKL